MATKRIDQYSSITPASTDLILTQNPTTLVYSKAPISSLPSGGGASATNLTTTAAPTTVTINSDTGTDAAIAAADATNAGLLLPAEKTKLTGIATGATANSPDATLLARANHTGTQTASTISDFSTAADARVAAATSTGTGAIVRATSPAITTPTGIVKGDVGLGNVDNTSDATKNAAVVTLTNKSISGATNTLTAIPESAVTNLTTDLAAKLTNFTLTAVKTANYTAAANELVPVDTTSGAVTITLPTAPTVGTRVGLKHVIQGGTNAVTLATGGTDVFNKTGGNTTASIPLLNQAVQFQYNAGIWYGVAGDIGVTALDNRYQKTVSLTTTGTSGAATFNSSTGVLNVPIYSSGSGASGITRSVLVISTPTTAGAASLIDYVYFVSGTTTLTLPTAIGNTNRYSVTNSDASLTTTVATTLSQTINGSTSITLIPGQSVDLISNNANWSIF